MNWYSQLTRLILSFYREDPIQLEQLQVIKSCRLSRRWGTLRIDCRDMQTANAVQGAIALIREPVAQLRLAQQISISVNGVLVRALPVHPFRLTT
ncbi:hypothetical protein H6G89_13590 [Oscillatoria sp. FACHB-1407]|uniref:hypothetical protein n=1 Tax=Oscillatoria sp. FACHB-1407 TaxID=2692847 RepID=UPI001683DF85|nr:hypothetical protein [Oscillatoria sp. FACHB-1407]MBD2462082.1 hypothetical protein [Oscillatoria sp. FACHB-1407]